jgi:hypothetical protein
MVASPFDGAESAASRRGKLLIRTGTDQAGPSVCRREPKETWHRTGPDNHAGAGLLLKGNTVAPATAELLRILHQERAWARLEDAVKRVEEAEARSREFTRQLDEWRAAGPD